MGYISLLIRSLYIPRNGHVTIPSSLVQVYGHHDYNRPCHHGPYDDSSYFNISTLSFACLYHSCILLFYHHTIMILTVLMTHMFSYLSLTLPGLSLDLHSFDYSFLSHLCPFLTQPALFSLSSFYFYLRCIIFGVTLCHGHSNIYSVITVWCSSLALIS